MSEDLEARLKAHAGAFEGLISLIPAKRYYGEDCSDQWQCKKKTKAQKRAAKQAKLDPASRKSAKDVMDERERKRRRTGVEKDLEDKNQDAECTDEGSLDYNVHPKEKPREGMKIPRIKKKKVKTEGANKKISQTKEITELKNSDGKEENKEFLSKAAKRKERQEKSAKKPEADTKNLHEGNTVAARSSSACTSTEIEHDKADDEINDIDVCGLSNSSPQGSTVTPSTLPSSPSSSAPSASSSSSILPHEAEVAASTSLHDAEKSDTSMKSRQLKLPSFDPETLKARLHAKIEALRAARKADGLDGSPARSRTELMEARRRKEAARKAHKKDLRRKQLLAQNRENGNGINDEVVDEQRLEAEEELARLRGSTSPFAGGATTSGGSRQGNNFSFSRVRFADGMMADAQLNALQRPRKKKGPSDPKTALEVAVRKRERIANMEEEKKKVVLERETWGNAKRKVLGEKVQDDPKLLQKTLKRKEVEKKKSAKAWKEREERVKSGQIAKQKRREENLKKRSDEKGGKKGKKVKGAVKKSKSAEIKRPGFEGSFRTRAR